VLVFVQSGLLLVGLATKPSEPQLPVCFIIIIIIIIIHIIIIIIDIAGRRSDGRATACSATS